MGELTGKQRYRTDWKGRVILQVEVAKTVPAHAAWIGGPAVPARAVGEWRDATISDLTATESPS